MFAQPPPSLEAGLGTQVLGLATLHGLGEQSFHRGVSHPKDSGADHTAWTRGLTGLAGGRAQCTLATSLRLLPGSVTHLDIWLNF